MSLTIIVAHSSNGVIGRSGGLPWHLPSDLRRFRDITIGHAVVMGRKTYESLPSRVRPLPGRMNIVITRNPSFSEKRCLTASSLEEAIVLSGGKAVYVIGGEQIYRLALPLASQIFLTLVEDMIDGDCYFPPLGEDWEETERSGLFFENNLEYRHLIYRRKCN